jgi:predicted dehydrogenase
VRIGLVGAGAIAARHISVLATIPEVEIAGVCDRDLARANRLAETAGAPVFDSWTSMLDAAALDAVFVCTPPGAHAAVAAAVLERGTAAYVEKPLARTAEDGRTIVGAWQSSGAVCAVGYQWRSLDLLQQIRTLLGEAPPGMLVSRSIAATERARGDRAQAAAAGGSWFVDPVQSGGILFELGSHDIDLQTAIAGPATSVQAVAGSGLLALSGVPESPLHDAVAVVIRFATGALGAVLVAWTEVDRPAVHELDVVAADAGLHLALDPHFRLTGRAHGREVDTAAAAEPRTAAVMQFLDAVRAADPAAVRCTPADALVTLEIALAAEEAVTSGRRVDLDGAGARG